jgi:hypothetical protein
MQLIVFDFHCVRDLEFHRFSPLSSKYGGLMQPRHPMQECDKDEVFFECADLMILACVEDNQCVEAKQFFLPIAASKHTLAFQYHDVHR